MIVVCLSRYISVYTQTFKMVHWSWRNKHSCCWIIYSDSWFTTERLVVCYDPPATTSCKDTKRRQAAGNVSRWATANLRSLIICRYSRKQQRPASEIRHRFLLLTCAWVVLPSSRSCHLFPTISSKHMVSHCCEHLIIIQCPTAYTKLYYTVVLLYRRI